MAKYISIIAIYRELVQGYNFFFMLNSIEYDFFLLINVKMPTIFGILKFMSGKNSILGLSEPKKAEFLDIFLYLLAFKILCSTHEKGFIT